MYESFFGLREKPYSLLPDPSFLYLSKIHQEALTLLEYGLRNQSGFTILTGEIGSGKTTLMRYLLDRLDDDITVGLISHTHHSLGQLMDWVCLAFDLTAPSGVKIDQHQAFVEFLIAQYAKGKRTLLIVDEAQNLGLDKLEELRLLSNINADKDLVLQLLLLGQPQLRQLLREPELEQFVQRVSASYHLGRLTSEETYRYIRHRLKVAGGQKGIFTADACHAVFHYSRGIPRIINLLCETALVCAYGAGERIVLGATIDQLVATQTSHLLITLDTEERSRLPEPVPEDIEPAAADEAPSKASPASPAATDSRPTVGHPPRVAAAEASPDAPDQGTGEIAGDAFPIDASGSAPAKTKPARHPPAVPRRQRVARELTAMAIALLAGFGFVYWFGAGSGSSSPPPTATATQTDGPVAQPTEPAADQPSPVDPAPAPVDSPRQEPSPAAEIRPTPPAEPVVTLPSIGEATDDSPDKADDTADTAVTAPAPGSPGEGAGPTAAADDQTATREHLAPPTAASEPLPDRAAGDVPGPSALAALETDLKRLSVQARLVDDTRLEADLEQSVTFTANSSHLDSASQTFLARLAGILRNATAVRLEVIAHTDSSGSDTFNLALSARRAEAVANYLIAQGIDAGRVTHRGKGKSELKADPEQEKRVGSWVNRRIEIDFTASGADEGRPAP